MINNNLPQIRFEGFDGEWEEKKLGDLGKVAMNKRIFKEETASDGEIPFYKIGTFGGVADSFISREKFEEYRAKYPYPKEGDLLLSASGSIGRVVEYDGEEAYYQDSNIVWLEHDERLENSFLKQFYSFVKWEGIEGTTIKRLYNKNIMDTKIVLPESTEQSAVGSLFQKLDRLIGLHQDRLALMKVQKQTYLKKMFPQKGQKVPDLRFAGFTDEWEEGKLGDLANFSKGRGYSKSSLVDSGVPIILYGRLYTNYQTTIDTVDTFAKLDETSVLSEGGDVIVPASGESSEEISRASVVKNKDIILSGDLNIIRVSKMLNPIFIALTISNGDQQKELSKRAQGKSIVHLHNSDLKEVKLIYPTLSEQTAIGNFFQSLDEAITLQESKVEELKEQKKTLLSKMFI